MKPTVGPAERTKALKRNQVSKLVQKLEDEIKGAEILKPETDSARTSIEEFIKTNKARLKELKIKESELYSLKYS